MITVLMYSFSHNEVETRYKCKNWFSLSCFPPPIFLMLSERERAFEKPVALLIWVMMLLPSPVDLSHHIVSMFVGCCDSLISRFGYGAVALPNLSERPKLECHLMLSHKVTVIKNRAIGCVTPTHKLPANTSTVYALIRVWNFPSTKKPHHCGYCDNTQ